MANHHEQHSASHGSVKSYIVGFILSIILTVIPYYLVTHGSMEHDSLVVTVIVIAVAQLLVQVIYFLHLSLRPEDRNNTMSFIFTMIVVLILVIGSIWIMWNLNYNMMDH